MGESIKQLVAWQVEQQRLWDREYREGHVIPSSIRPSPSKALLIYEGLVDFARLTPVLDAGCGNGRNAIYLAGKGCEVHAVDFSEEALGYLKHRAHAAGLLDSIHVHNLALREHWPFPDDHFGLVLDSYVFCHIVDSSEQEAYRHELRRVIRASGMLYSAVFCIDDAYYRELLQASNISSRIVLDPRNGIRKYLYTEEEFRDFFSMEFRIVYFTKFQFDDVVLDRVYRRSILTLLAQK